MKPIMCLFVIVLSLFSSSCVISYYPMAENINEYQYDPTLYGTWNDTSEKVEVFIDTAGISASKKYSITLINHEKKDELVQDTSFFQAFIVKSGGKTFINLHIDKENPQFKKVGTTAVDLIPETYVILKLEKKNGRLHLSDISEDVLTKLIKNKRFSVKYVRKEEDKVLLTEGPKILKLKMNELDKHKDAFQPLLVLSKGSKPHR